MKLRLAIAALALSTPTLAVVDEGELLAEANEMIQEEKVLLAEELELLEELNITLKQPAAAAEEPDIVTIDFDGEDVVEEEESGADSAAMNMVLNMMTSTSAKLTTEGERDGHLDDELIAVTSVAEPALMSGHADSNEEHESVIETIPAEYSAAMPAEEEHHHHESNHQHKKSEKVRAKAAKDHKGILPSMEAKSIKEQPAAHGDDDDEPILSHEKGPDSKVSKHPTHSMSLPYVKESKTNKSKSSKHSKSKGAKHAKGGDEEHDSSMSMDPAKKKHHSKTHKDHDMSMKKKGEGAPMAKAKKGRTDVTSSDITGTDSDAMEATAVETATYSTIPAASRSGETTTPAGIIIFTEAPETEDQEAQTANKDALTQKSLATDPSPETSTAAEAPSSTTKTQSVIRTPDISPGTDTSNLSSVNKQKYAQEVKDVLLNGSLTTNDKPQHTGHHMMNSKENVDALDLGKESEWENSNVVMNGVAMADVDNSSSGSVDRLTGVGLCLVVVSAVSSYVMMA